MVLWISERKEHLRPCLDCGLQFPHITGYVLDAEGPRAVYFASCHTHAGPAARIDVILGTWGADPPADDHVTFSCEVRASGAMALDAPVTLTGKRPALGATLTRPEALAHPWAAEFWAVIDLIATEIPLWPVRSTTVLRDDARPLVGNRRGAAGRHYCSSPSSLRTWRARASSSSAT